jgi:hypothetical protein
MGSKTKQMFIIYKKMFSTFNLSYLMHCCGRFYACIFLKLYMSQNVKILPIEFSTDFQTPKVVAEYMASFLPDNCGTILEPTPGIGNLVNAAKHKGKVIAPMYFEDIEKGSRFDWAIMNPPFTPMKEGFRYLKEVMEMTDNIVALLPWFIIINSERRLNDIKNFGLVSVTHLPRKTFPGCRIQCCLLELRNGYCGNTHFRTLSW